MRARLERAPRRALLLVGAVLVTLFVAIPALSQQSTTLTVTPDAGPVGETVTAVGTGFDRDFADDVVITFDGEEVAVITDDDPAWQNESEFTTTFVVPERPADPTVGGYVVIAGQDFQDARQGPTSRQAPSYDIMARDLYTIVPTLVITPIEGPEGTEITMSGSGWDRGELLTIDLPVGDAVATVPANGADWTSPSRFRTTVIAPALPADTYDVQAHQFERKLLQEGQFTVLPTFEVDPNVGRVGSQADAIGGGYDRDFPVDIVFDGEVVRTLPANDPDWTSPTTFRTSFDVPPRTDAGYVVEGVQDCGGGCDRRESAPFSVIGLTLVVDPDDGIIGSTTTVTGGGYSPLLDVSVFFDGTLVTVVPSADVNDDGTFSLDIEVPARAAGPYDVVACQACATARRLEASAPFTVLPTLDVDPNQGEVGDVIEVGGTAYDPTEDLVILIDGVEVATFASSTGTVGADNEFRVEIEIPAIPYGDHVVTGCQRCGDPDEITADDDLRVLPTFEFELPLGPRGFPAIAVGRGFPASTQVQLEWQPGIDPRPFTTRPDGTFRVSVLVFQRDAVGPRVGIARVFADDALPVLDQFPDPEAEYLVVLGTQQPGDFVIRH